MLVLRAVGFEASSRSFAGQVVDRAVKACAGMPS